MYMPTLPAAALERGTELPLPPASRVTRVTGARHSGGVELGVTVEEAV